MLFISVNNSIVFDEMIYKAENNEIQYQILEWVIILFLGIIIHLHNDI